MAGFVQWLGQRLNLPWATPMAHTPGVGFWNHRYGGTQIDWLKEAGDVMLNPVFNRCVTWKAAQVLKHDIVFEQKVGAEWKEVPDSPLVALLNDPNPMYGMTEFVTQTIANLDAWGNCFWALNRNGRGGIAGLILLPNERVTVVTDPDRFVTIYYYDSAKGRYQVDPRDVIHIRSTIIDPFNQAMGRAPAAAIIRDIAADNGATNTLGNVLIRGGMPSHLIAGSVNGEPLKEDQLDKGRERLRRYQGDDRGQLALVGFDAKVYPLDWKPKDLGIDTARAGAAQRICMVLGVPPVVIGEESGLSNQNNRASAEAAIRLAYTDTIVPLMAHIARQLWHQLSLPLGMDTASYRLRFQLTEEGERSIFGQPAEEKPDAKALPSKLATKGKSDPDDTDDDTEGDDD